MKRISLLERLFGPRQKKRSRVAMSHAAQTNRHIIKTPTDPFDLSAASTERLEFGAIAGSKGRISYPVEELCGSHYLCGAATGHGKSRLVAGLVMKHIRHLVRFGHPGVVVLDPKSETIDLVLRLIAEEFSVWSKEEQERVLSSLVVVAPCRSDAPVTPLQLLAAPAEEAESRAVEVSEALTQGIESDLGILQETALCHVLALAIESKEDWSFVELPHLLSSEDVLQGLAASSALPGPKAYILSGRFGKEAFRRISGIQARVEKLLRVERLRLALGAPKLIDLKESFQGKITLVDLGSDFGGEEAARIVGRLVFSRLVSALFSQPPEKLVQTLLVCEEFPDLLGKGLGAKAEKIFSQARSRKTGCMVLFQAPAQLQNGGLLRVLQANARFTIVGQMPPAEIRPFEDLLPTTGKVARKLEPGEVLPKSAYLNPAEEKTYRMLEASRLSRGVFLFSDRRRQEEGCFIKADHCDPPSWADLEKRLPADTLAKVRSGSAAIPLDEARRGYEARLERFAKPEPLAEPPAPAQALPSRRSRRKRGTVP